MRDKVEDLKRLLTSVNDLNSAAAVLYWDKTTYMPAGGAEARGRQLATLTRLAHEKFTSDEVGMLLDELSPYADSLPYQSFEASLIRVARRDFDKKTKVPAQLLADIAVHATASYAAWAQARDDNDFTLVKPYLEKMLGFSHQYADCFPGYDHVADPLIDLSDGGMKAKSIRSIFADLRRELVPLVQAITSQPPADNSCLLQRFPEDKQLSFSMDVARAFGYDLHRGRLDKTHHPFMIKFSLGDVRITTRVKERDLTEALFSTLHEAGHAMYEQGIDQALEGTLLARGASSGVHESQSRLWENQVGRSRWFWNHYYPRLQAAFPEQLGNVSLDSFYRAINRVQTSLIRTDADEVTYNLHVMIRFDLALQMLEGTLAVKDLPEAWRARYQSDLGILPPTDSDGVLQDVHWFDGLIGGAFQGYTLGNIMSSSFFGQALQTHPEIPAQMETGDFSTLLRWLQRNIYRHGGKFTADELVAQVTGGPISIEPYIDYLRRKFGALYAL